ncbi:hypothetical protein BD779DRAFT_1012664 [Infundibulicybe gibba]|nr:hypothetical protein BD779DRAFT_1012664 [Infundibulicybe gibba]
MKKMVFVIPEYPLYQQGHDGQQSSAGERIFPKCDDLARVGRLMKAIRGETCAQGAGELLDAISLGHFQDRSKYHRNHGKRGPALRQERRTHSIQDVQSPVGFRPCGLVLRKLLRGWGHIRVYELGGGTETRTSSRNEIISFSTGIRLSSWPKYY